MADWKYRLKIRHLFQDVEPSQEGGVSAATNVLEELKTFRSQHQPLSESCAYELDDIEDMLKEATQSSVAVADFNYALELLYDFADANLVWVE